MMRQLVEILHSPNPSSSFEVVVTRGQEHGARSWEGRERVFDVVRFHAIGERGGDASWPRRSGSKAGRGVLLYLRV